MKSTKAFAAARDVWDVLDEDNMLPEKADAVELQPLRDKIVLKNVTFQLSEQAEKYSKGH